MSEKICQSCLCATCKKNRDYFKCIEQNPEQLCLTKINFVKNCGKYEYGKNNSFILCELDEILKTRFDEIGSAFEMLSCITFSTGDALASLSTEFENLKKKILKNKKQQKEEIKRIRRMIKYCKNPLQKRCLTKQLNELYKKQKQSMKGMR